MRDGYLDLTIHGITDLHQARAKEKGEPSTIRDHLILDDVNDLPLLNTLYRRLYLGLKEGGEFHHLLGSTYLLNERRGGRQPEGFGADPPRGHDKLKFNPGNALVSLEMKGIADREFNFIGTVPAIIRAGTATATIPSKRKQEQIAGAPLALEQELAFERQRNEFLERELALKDELLRGGRVLPAGALEAPRRGRPSLQPSNGNGTSQQH